jgi:hypothetical protein
MGGQVDQDNVKTVSVQVTAGEEKALSRTRRRKRTPAVQRTEELEQANPVTTIVAKPILVEKKPETPAAPIVAPPTVEPKSETPVKKPIQLGRKKNETRKNTPTTAASAGTPGAAGNGTLVPKIIYGKKRTQNSTLRTQMSPSGTQLKPVLRVKTRKSKRTFKARQIAVTVGASRVNGALKSSSKMREELEKHGVLPSNSKMPDEKLRRLYQDFRALKDDAF